MDSPEKQTVKWSWKRVFPQFLGATAFGLLILNVSMIICSSTVVISGLISSKDMEISPEEISWLGSIVFLVQPIGSICSGFTQDWFGRRRSMMATTFPHLAGWIMIAYAQNVTTILVATVIMSLGIGFLEAPAMSYLGEVCEPTYRGTLAAYSETFLLFGILVEFLLGSMMYWRTVIGISAVIPLFCFFMLYAVPESPTWLVVKNRHKEAEEALKWLRGGNDVTEEFKELLAYVEIEASRQGGVINLNQGIIERFKVLVTPQIYKPMFLVTVYFIIYAFASLLALRPTLVEIFDDYGVKNSYDAVVISGVTQAIGSVVCFGLMRLLGKRNLALITLAGCTASCFAIAILMYLRTQETWLISAFNASLYFFNGAGLITLPWTLICEIYPLEGRGIAAGVTAANNYLVGFIVSKTYINLLDWLTLPGAVVLYGSVGLAGLVYLYFCLPETDGKTLLEIQQYFDKTLVVDGKTKT